MSVMKNILPLAHLQVQGADPLGRHCGDMSAVPKARWLLGLGVHEGVPSGSRMLGDKLRRTGTFLPLPEDVRFRVHGRTWRTVSTLLLKP